MIRLSGPTSVWKKAPSGDTLTRSFSPSAKRFSASATDPGFKRYVRISMIMALLHGGVTGQY